MINKVLTLISYALVGTLLYFWINKGQYNTVFLPFLEGIITLSLFIFWLLWKRVKVCITDNQITYIPIFSSVVVVLLVIVINIIINPFGSDRISYIDDNQGILVSFFDVVINLSLFPLGGLGIPLGMFIGALWPLLTFLGVLGSSALLLVVPSLISIVELHKVSQSIQKQNQRKFVYIYLVYPILILLLIIPVLSVLANVREITAVMEENTWQVNHDSYEIGKEIQHALEASVYRNGEYHEKFPSTLEKLVEWNLIDSIPRSPVGNREYLYTLDPNEKNYTICFPQTEGDRCERSWSRE